MPEFAELARDEAMQVVGGAVAPLAGVLMVPLVSMVGSAVDLGYLSIAKSDLQNAADSAALVGGGLGGRR